ncbi:MAG TPA: TIM barrel protein [Syntrophales bacterium]|nr:TIM barrel protein [Syntrophales bacterium]HOD97270.1 TIM barrel protein [Syntrophales bacterium]HOH72014.1 TIM barrel protein [Syntrophales bacterium]HPN07807.1 TIM barrel protein [Syntrophales bacterium]HPX80265.1 TIM barrel protein [Syntrophales bacterium]
MAFKYGMKAAVFPSQLQDRRESFRRLGLPPVIELHLFGARDVFHPEAAAFMSGVRRLGEACRFIVHFPIMDVETGYLFDAIDDDPDKLTKVLAFTEGIGAAELVMHCCYGFNRDIPKQEARRGFIERVARWNDLAAPKGVRILLENYGFVWLPPGLGAEYAVSPLDHCFPWDMAILAEAVGKLGLGSVGFLLDTAHAVLSANMFNMRQRHGHLAGDVRFGNIYAEDLAQAEYLTAADFVNGFIEYFHVSDACRWRPDDGLDEMDKYLYTEGLPIGRGNVDFAELLGKVRGDETLIMEIDPENGDHGHNVSQYEAVVRLRKIFG